MGSTSALCNSEGSTFWLFSIGPYSPVFQPHGSRKCHVRPCERNDGQNAVPARFLRTILGPLALESVGVLLRPASDLFRVWQIPIWRFDAEQVTNEEILHAPLTIGASHCVTTDGHHQKIKVLVRFDERIDKTVDRFRGPLLSISPTLRKCFPWNLAELSLFA